MPMSFIMSKNVEHSSEKTPRELMEIAPREDTSVISTHFVTVARKGHYNFFFLLKLSRDN